MSTHPVLLDQRLWFPPAGDAVVAGSLRGLVAVGGDLSVDRLVLAYRSGIFPWSARPITWWSPDPRAIIELDQFHVPRRLAALLRRAEFTVTVNRDFRAVIEQCAARHREQGEWISPEFVGAYTQLHEAGHAHSIEAWRGDALAGGLYGVAVGGLFAGESMFHAASNASKVALCHAVARLRERVFALFDIQMLTPVTRQFGAVTVPRSDYLCRLAAAVKTERQFD